MFIINNRSIFLTIAAVMIAVAFGLVASFGLNPSIDFQGGTVYEVSYTSERPQFETVVGEVGQVVPGATVQFTGENGVIIKTVEITDEQKKDIDTGLATDAGLEFDQLRFKQLGPAISTELQNKSIFAILFVVFVIVLFIAYTFREVSKPVSSFKYGLVAIVALIHDTIIPIGVFAILGSIFIDYQIDVLFITALLATLGYSINDTIVVFDRVRENLRLAHQAKEEYAGDAFKKIVATSLSQTFKRSFYTSVTTLIALSFLFFMGGDATKPFALVLGIGVIAGTYSSLFLACPLLVFIESHQKEEGGKDESENTDGVDDDLPDDVKRFLEKQKS